MESANWKFHREINLEANDPEAAHLTAPNYELLQGRISP